MPHEVCLLAIETSCDETSAAVYKDRKILSNIVFSQTVHQLYGGVIPELASRAHLKHIHKIVQMSLNTAFPNLTQKQQLSQLNAIGVTNKPGLIGSLMVGTQFAKSLALALKIPLIGVNHLDAHVYSNFILTNSIPYPFLCLTVSGGHTQIILVEKELEFICLGETIDDAAGECFDKIGKLIGLPYPSGHLIDKFSKNGNPLKFKFPIPQVPDFNYSFSGLKTAVMYFVKKNGLDFINEHKTDFCASIQYTIIQTLMQKFMDVVKKYNIKTWCLAGGVSANSKLREVFNNQALEKNAIAHIPPFEYCTDNAAMIAKIAALKHIKNRHDPLTMDVSPNC
ncbi:MAG: tRNA (adenosine(37)-N6)-threonylcarbamoyltransferase complex transferase subunit TsaD [Alphaproteobacteria bacterium]|nr:tRNA (adenosine(37)-N6)-threonylcarbamoyltransferase complex transferase subunit TsaD [Alphaproteobacteria bacterium]